VRWRSRAAWAFTSMPWRLAQLALVESSKRGVSYEPAEDILHRAMNFAAKGLLKRIRASGWEMSSSPGLAGWDDPSICPRRAGMRLPAIESCATFQRHAPNGLALEGSDWECRVFIARAADFAALPTPI